MIEPKLYDKVALHDGKVGDVVYVLGGGDAFIVEIPTGRPDDPYEDVTVAKDGITSLVREGSVALTA